MLFISSEFVRFQMVHQGHLHTKMTTNTRFKLRDDATSVIYGIRELDLNMHTSSFFSCEFSA